MKILESKKTISPLQMTLTLALVLALILSNILVVKSVDLFGIKQLANTTAIITFPLTYVLSDVFSEVYGYKWSRITATLAFLGSAFCSVLFYIMIALPGNSSWENQEALVTILGQSPKITAASVFAFWVGDLANDLVFKFMKNKDNGGKLFFLRAIMSSLVGKYVDGAIFTFIGLSFLPMETKITMVLTCPFAQILIETALLPVTIAVAKIIQKTEDEQLSD